MPETPDFPALTASDGNEPPPEGARFSPAAERNRQPILDALRRRRGKRSSLVIAHRLSTLAHADHVIVLEHGRIIQHGTHQELLENEGLYQKLWTIQNAPDDTPPTP